MSKRKRKPDFQQKLISKGDYRNFARVHYDLFYDARFMSLSPTARLIYIAMILECGKNDSRTKCKFPNSAYMKICSKQTFIRCKRELIENGFIRENAFRTTSNIYYLCNDWKLDAIPKREPEYHDVSEHDKLLKG